MRGSDEQPVFVIGSPRSGTSLLRLMLTSHPLLVIPPEAGFAMWLYPSYESWTPADGIEGFVADLLETRKIEFWHLDRDRLVADLEAFTPVDYGGLVASVYRTYAAKVKPQAVRWGDKNNTYVTEVHRIHQLFPNARFAHIVRDGRNVAVSYRRVTAREVRSRYAPRLPTDIADIAREWSSNVMGASAAIAEVAPEVSVTVRLEDLTARPRETLDSVCRAVGLEFDDAMLRYHELSERDGGEPEEFLQWKEKNVLPVQDDGADEYRAVLSPDEIAAFEATAGSTLARFGYLV